MAADLRIHILTCEEEDVAKMNSHTLGSKHFNMFSPSPGFEVFEKIHETPSIWIGEVSWLKAGICEDGQETFVPSTVQAISELVGEEFPVIDDEFIKKIKEAFALENKTGYSLAEVGEVVEFLEQYKGRKVFTISW